MVDGAGGGRVLRRPFDAATGRLVTAADGQVHAKEGFSSPVWGVQGAVARNEQLRERVTVHVPWTTLTGRP